MEIKNIIFDLGGVLLDIDLNYCMRQMQALGIDLDALKKKGMQTQKWSPSGKQYSENGFGCPPLHGAGSFTGLPGNRER